eukprot:scaffold4543_cov36-Attheya_sp.AAC.2
MNYELFAADAGHQHHLRHPNLPQRTVTPYYTTALFFVAVPHMARACCWRFAGCVVNVPHTNSDR